jgi:protein phosphatase
MRGDMAIEIGAKTDIGTVRTNNEDTYAVNEDIGLFIVADGMGGHNAGEVASKMASEIISRNMRQYIENKSNLTKNLSGSIELANEAIYEASRKYTQNQGMGTTVAALLEKEDSHIIGWVGDSRIYLVRHNTIQQISSDHSLVQEQVNKGLISQEDAKKSEYKNVLTRALGTNSTVQVDVAEIPAFDNDYLILCSDGLTGVVGEDQILKTIQEIKDSQQICDKLIETAKENGSRDNITVLVAYKKSKNILEKIKSIIS